jgi:formylglycine-generating enzyme required for sulfatase activity
MKKKPPAGPGEGERDVQVTLKPIFGVHPGAYLTVLYVVALLGILFLLLVYPGIAHHGANTRFTSTPSGASVYVDGTRVGATPCTVYVEGGERVIEFRKPHHETRRLVRRVPGRVVGSLIVPKRFRTHADLPLPDAEAFLAGALEEFAGWALFGQSTERYRMPLIASAALSDLYAGGRSADPALVDAFVQATLRYTVSEYSLKDVMRTASLAGSNGAVLTHQALLHTASRFTRLLTRLDYLPLWLLAALPAETAAIFEDSDWFSRFLRRYRETVALLSQSHLVGPGESPRVTIAGNEFVPVPSVRFLMGSALAGQDASLSLDTMVAPRLQTVSGFSVMATEVTNRHFARFVEANPEWGPDQREALEAQGLVDQDYLLEWSTTDYFPPEDADLPVVYVSHAAAEAYCMWLSEQLPPSVEGLAVRLPTEAEWEWTTRRFGNSAEDSRVPADGRHPVGSRSPADSRVHDLRGNVWEWCLDWYYPADPYLSSWDGLHHLDTRPFRGGVERVVRGGSWANRGGVITESTRGSQPPQWCTAFLGFRPVLVQE